MERAIDVTVGAIRRELKNHLQGRNKGVYASTEEGTVHLVEEVTKFEDVVYATTPVGVKKVKSAKVLL